MHVIGDRDVHRVDVLLFLLEQLAPVLIDADLGESLLQRHDAAEIDIGHGDELERRVPRERPHVGQRLTGRPDARVAQRRARGAGTD